MKTKETLEEFLISHLLVEFIPKLELWVEYNVFDSSTKDFYNTLIRLFKGQIRAWRRWRLLRNS